MVTPHLDLEAIKDRVKAALTTERIADVVVTVSTVAVLGTVLSFLHRAMENYTIVPF
jgi:hypothetical protein